MATSTLTSGAITAKAAAAAERLRERNRVSAALFPGEC